MTERTSIDYIWDAIMKSSPAEDWLVLDRGETIYAILKSDVNLRVEATHSPDKEPFEAEWAGNFPDENAQRVMCEVAYNATPLRDFVFARVDGGRAYLPGTQEPSPLEWQLARIINQDESIFYESAKQAGFKISAANNVERHIQSVRKKIMGGLKMGGKQL